MQVVVDLVLALGLVIAWFRLKRPPQDDPRLSRGLQLLQSKISVLEDLSDRTDNQVKQLTTLIDQKTRLLQTKVIESEHQIQRIEQSMLKSREVAEIFQDRIPHEEVRQRQETIKYVRAAQLAHGGRSVQEIAQIVDLPLGQIEMIQKVNRDHLVFDPEALPEWAKTETRASAEAMNPTNVDFQLQDKLLLEDEASDFAGEVFEGAERPSAEELRQATLLSTAALTSALTSSGMAESRTEEAERLQRLGQEFRQAMQPAAAPEVKAAPAAPSRGQTPLSGLVRKVQFPKVNTPPANSTPLPRS